MLILNRREITSSMQSFSFLKKRHIIRFLIDSYQSKNERSDVIVLVVLRPQYQWIICHRNMSKTWKRAFVAERPKLRDN